MANRAVKLYRKCKTPTGWRRLPAVFSANGRVKPGAVIDGGVELTYSEGHYELRSYDGTKTVWTRVDGTASDAAEQLKIASKKKLAMAVADDAGIKVVAEAARKTIKDEASRFVAATLDRGSTEAGELYERSLNEFRRYCLKTYVDELEHADITRFHASMRKAGRSPRTIANRHGHVRSFLKFCRFPPEQIKEIAGQKPRYEKTLPEVYPQDELRAFFESLDKEAEKLLFDVLLQCGLREQEVMHLEYSDFSIAAMTLKVQSKPRWGFKVKDAEQREVPVPQPLMDRIVAFKEQQPGPLLFGVSGDKTDGHLLRKLKRLVNKAGLNCGTCSGCQNKPSACERWFLHKFRSTYITTLLRNGVDLRTAMSLSGHSDLESVMRYLRPAEGSAIQQSVNAIQWR